MRWTCRRRSCDPCYLHRRYIKWAVLGSDGDCTIRIWLDDLSALQAPMVATSVKSIAKASSNSSLSQEWDVAEKQTIAEPRNWFERLVRFLEVKQRHGGSATRAEGIVESFLYNDDLAPVEAKRRSWTWKQFVYFWISGAFNVNTWQISATGLQCGLNWWQTWICVWVGYSLVAGFLVLGSRVGNIYHIAFPISSRVTFGTYFSVWIVINRVVMACVWYATLAWLGGKCVQLMLLSIFGNDLAERLGDHIPSKNLNDFEMLCYILFWLFSLPFLWLPPHSLRYLFAAKSVITPFAAFGFLIWAIKKSNGNFALGALMETKSDVATSWAVIRALMSALDNFSTLVLNAPDFSRFAKSPKSSIYSQLFILPVVFSTISLIGILVTASTYTIYHVNEWDPLKTLGRFLSNYGKGDRAGVFLIAAIFCFDQLGANLANNAIPAGTDMTALLPKFVNIRRGSYICAVLALVICPWNLLSGSETFVNALAAYAVFLSAIAGVISADYYIVRKGYVNLRHCYSNRPDSYYMYNKYGTNWRAVVAYVVGIVPNFPGFLGSLGVSVPIGATKVYYCNYFVGYFISAIVYLVLVHFFPVAGVPNNAKLLDFSQWHEEWQEVENFSAERLQYEKYGEEAVTSGFEIKQQV
ncbi:AaceriAFR598Cp [[Ashbya] aceris (nom. inval.)]|nr:AaceriAFR598Cp [[Ashbya] aceris (nom. inval.)]